MLNNIGRNCRLHRWRGSKTCSQAYLSETGIPQIFSLWVVQLGCSPSTFDGRLIRCCWDCVMKEERINRKGLYFGHRVKLESFPAPFKEWIEDAAKVWDDAVTKDTEECWKKWKYF